MVSKEETLLSVTKELDIICNQLLNNLTVDVLDEGIATVQQLIEKRQTLLEQWTGEPAGEFIELNQQVQQKMERIFLHTTEQVRSVRTKQQASRAYRQQADTQGSFFDARE